MKANILKRLDDLEQKARMKSTPKQPSLIMISWRDDKQIIEVIEDYTSYAATGKVTGYSRKTFRYDRLSDYTFRAECKTRVITPAIKYPQFNLYAFIAG